MDKLVNEILDFWTDAGMEGWYKQSPEFDDEIRSRFHEAWTQARDGQFSRWQLDARSALALIILLDQFPRNMFRGDKASFSTDRMARCVAQKALMRNFDKEIDGPMQQFFYLPFMHSECLMDQDSGVRAFITRMPGTSNLLHARASTGNSRLRTVPVSERRIGAYLYRKRDCVSGSGWIRVYRSKYGQVGLFTASVWHMV